MAASVGVGQSMANIVDYTRNNTLAAAVILEVPVEGGHTIGACRLSSDVDLGEANTGRMPGRSRRRSQVGVRGRQVGILRLTGRRIDRSKIAQMHRFKGLQSS